MSKVLLQIEVYIYKFFKVTTLKVFVEALYKSIHKIFQYVIVNYSTFYSFLKQTAVDSLISVEKQAFGENSAKTRKLVVVNYNL